jgi:glycosyltransferase involved in cell wall biosynthesis
METTVSVVIPAYNAAGFVSRAIESCLAQTYRPIEIIVVDDGSSDNTAEIVSRFSHPVRLIQRANGGPAAARNDGAREATGDWLALLDADDYWFPDKLRVQLQQQDISPDVAVVYCLFDNYSGMQVPSEVTFEDLWNYNWIGNSSALVRRSAFTAIGGFHEDRAMISVEDYNLWIRLAAAGWRLVLCPHVLVHYEPGVGISWDFDRLLRASLYNLDDLEKAIPVDKSKVDAKRREVQEEFARRALGSRHMAVARRGFRKVFFSKPTLRSGLYFLAACMPRKVLDIRRNCIKLLPGGRQPNTPNLW